MLRRDATLFALVEFRCSRDVIYITNLADCKVTISDS